MTVVVDASVAVCALADDPRSAVAERLFAAAARVHAPDLIVAEVANAGWRLQRAGEITPEHLDGMQLSLDGLIDQIHPLASLAPRAVEIARTLDHPVYDCFYLALAEELGVPLATFDTRLLGRLAGTAFADVGYLPDEIPAF